MLNPPGLSGEPKKGARKDTVEYPNRTPFPKKRLGGTIVGNHYPGRRFQSLY